ncbi:MAG TPA: helix-turn-helix domain-containing protein [Nocardioidaceae bacterium]|nr:helix-turn-helix domain-containing protein [Nocardioidaceae bacterium]
MVTALDVVTSVGPSVFHVLVPGDTSAEVADIFLAEPGHDSVGERGDLVLGVGFGTADAYDAVHLLQRCRDTGASGLVLRETTAGDPDVRLAAERHGMLLVGLREELSWAHVVWMLRGVVDRAAAPGSPAAGDAGVHNDLFVLADAAAAIVDAPVTIEDNLSRVLAYSSGQSRTDTARVSTIVGRRVPPEVVAHYRARGVFRRLARSSEPFLIPEGADGTLPRLVVPVRAGDEWLGSIWAVVSGPVSEEVTAELRNAAGVLALHLLRLRAQADVARRNSVERIRAAIRHFTPGTLQGLSLPAGPWRVVALSAPATETDVRQQIDLWAAICRRYSWADPLLADMDGTVFALVTDGATPGSWTWLRRLVENAHRDDPSLRAAAGSPAPSLAELPRSRAGAAELLALTATDGPAVAEFDTAWVPLTIHRATGALDLGGLGGPVTELLEHDRDRGTAYVETLRAWLAYPGEPQRAAGELHVHPNTLRHRMKRLAEVIELDLRDPRQRLALQLQLEAASRRG